MSESNWASIDVLRHFWLDVDSAGPPNSRIEGAFQAVTEDLVDAVMPNKAERLAAGQRGLRALFLAVTAADQAAEPAEDSPAFAVGRLVGLLDVAGNAIRRVWIGSLEAKVEHDEASLKIIKALHQQNAALTTSTDLVNITELAKDVVSRKLVRLESLHLVATSRLGKYLVSQLTMAGSSFASRRFAEQSGNEVHVSETRDFNEVISEGDIQYEAQDSQAVHVLRKQSSRNSTSHKYSGSLGKKASNWRDWSRARQSGANPAAAASR